MKNEDILHGYSCAQHLCLHMRWTGATVRAWVPVRAMDWQVANQDDFEITAGERQLESNYRRHFVNSEFDDDTLIGEGPRVGGRASR